MVYVSSNFGLMAFKSDSTLFVAFGAILTSYLSCVCCFQICGRKSFALELQVLHGVDLPGKYSVGMCPGFLLKLFQYFGNGCGGNISHKEISIVNQ